LSCDLFRLGGAGRQYQRARHQRFRAHIGGQFQRYGGAPAENLAKVDLTTGVLDQTFTKASGAGGATEWIDSIAIANGSVYAGANLASYRGSAVQALIKVDAAGGVLDTTFTQTLGIWGRAETRGYASSNLIELDLSSGAPVSACLYSGACDSCAANLAALSVINGRLYVGADAATLYRGAPTYFGFPVDLTTGVSADP
jgi:hypothetical protein